MHLLNKPLLAMNQWIGYRWHRKFHWTEFDTTVKESLRVLRKNGRFTALWNPRLIEVNPLLIEIENHLSELNQILSVSHREDQESLRTLV